MEFIWIVAFWSQIISLTSSLENLAFNKLATQSSNLYDDKWLAGAAVDGNGNQSLSGDSCACTDHYKPTVWWKVNLGDVYSISKVNIFYRDDLYRITFRLSGFKLYVTLQDNFIVSSQVYVNNDGEQKKPYPPANFTVTVATYGQYVTLYKARLATCTPDASNTNFCALFELCEVQVLGCQKKKYGTDCQSDCPKNCLYDVCAVSDGKCYGCKDGYTNDRCNQPCVAGTYGPGCSKECSDHCKEGASCDVRNGSCPAGCSDGYKGSYCNKTCSPGMFGSSCSSNCGSCKNNITCDHVNGSCPNGCEFGYIGKYCKTACPFGKYGKNCNDDCSGKCLNGDTCNIQTGHCDNGCAAGWKGDKCDKVCERGKFGLNCQNTCSRNCANKTTCSTIDGSCHYGCKNGWKGKICNEKCETGGFGPNCIDICGKCINGTACDMQTFICHLGCEDGYMGSVCKDKCETGNYGPKCSLKCVTCNTTCHHVTGKCPEVPETSDIQELRLSFIIYGVLSSVIICVLVVIMSFCFLRKKCSLDFGNNTNKNDFECSVSNKSGHTAAPGNLDKRGSDVIMESEMSSNYKSENEKYEELGTFPCDKHNYEHLTNDGESTQGSKESCRRSMNIEEGNTNENYEELNIHDEPVENTYETLLNNDNSKYANM